MNRAWHLLATAAQTRNEPRHRWYWVKEGFSPLLVRTAVGIEECAPTDLVVDPFCGSGTTPLEAARQQLPSAGAEINPFLAFAANAKTLTPTESSLSVWSNRVRQAIHGSTYSPLIGVSTFAKTRRKRGLFNQEVLKGFRGAWRLLEAAPDVTRSLSEKQCSKRYTSLVECKDANYSMTKSRLL